MKKVLKSISVLAAVSALSFTMPSCSNSNDKKNKEVKSEEQVQSTDKMHEDADMDHDEHVYACPMHPEVTGKEGDKCSKCDMDLDMVEHEHTH